MSIYKNSYNIINLLYNSFMSIEIKNISKVFMPEKIYAYLIW